MKKGSTCSARTPLRIRNDLGTQLFVSYRKGKSVKDILVRAKL